MNGVSSDALCLRLFPFSLKDKALHHMPSRSITTWDQLSHTFLAKYFPLSKTTQLKNQITSFAQKGGESLYNAWKCFKELLYMCPYHGLEKWLIVHTSTMGWLIMRVPQWMLQLVGHSWTKIWMRETYKVDWRYNTQPLSMVDWACTYKQNAR